MNSDVLVTRAGLMGRITLNRPRAINALTLEMLRAIDAALSEWEASSDVATVVIDGAGDRGLCAGGDIRAIYDAVLAGDPALARDFWRNEYRLNARIARYPKPVVAVMDGIVMGGGVGLSGHASLRVVTDRTTLAMPEVSIGFAPDVGGTWLLSRAPGEVGTHLALTAARIGPADVIACGLADYYVPTSALPRLFDLLAAGNARGSLNLLGEQLPAGTIYDSRSWIDECYAPDTVEEIVERLRQSDRAPAGLAADELASKSPTSLKVALRALREARFSPNLEQCLDREYRIATTFLDIPDYAEGVRAAIVDKDRNPRWRPDQLESVGNEVVDRFFAARDDELGLAKGPAR